MKKNMPVIIKEVGFDFSWEEKKVWNLDLPVEDMSINDLLWHFDMPFWNTTDGNYDLKPIDVIDNPEKYRKEYERVMKSDVSYPLDIMFWKQRWLLLDGLHRLVKLSISGCKTIKVHKVPKSQIPSISK